MSQLDGAGRSHDTFFQLHRRPDVPPFQWDRPDADRYRIGNLPVRVLPEGWGDLGVLGDVMKLAQDGAYEGRQIDWGAWAFRMTGRQVQAFFTNDAERNRLLAGRDPERTYLLVAAEGV